MPYDKSKFRSVKHGVEEESWDCRHCKEEGWGIGSTKEGYTHAKNTGHTVDAFREHRVEYTSYVKSV